MALGQGKSEAEAFGEVIDLGKELKHLFAVFLVDALSCVFHNETDAAAGMCDAHGDLLAIGVFCGIVEQFSQTAHQV